MNNSVGRFFVFIVCVSVFSFLAASCVGIPDKVGDLIPGGASKEKKLDEKTIIAGLKEALEIGTKKAVEIVSKKNGYFKNKEIFIPLPKDLNDVAKKLRSIGFKKDVDKFIEDMNHAAEKAAEGAVDIFVDAIKKMTMKDARKILEGADDEATRYFEDKTRKKLYDVFFPVVKKAMDKLGVTKLYKFLIDTYNGIPGVKKVKYDLDAYITNRALDGLFLMLSKEEKKIRKDPAARVTELLKKVFGSL
ncbi:MAG: DUF4197 domain-containing protein [Spirochaetales bacterium]|nr:DUF4197 domain-containing protein [Spirochaetales bacterium]